MYFIYAMALLAVLVSSVIVSYPREKESVYNESAAILLNMSSWHKAAVRLCADTTCSGGVINPSARIPEMLTSNLPRMQRMFETRFDPASRIIVTYLKPNALALGAGGPSYQSINSTVKDTLARQTSQVGVFRASPSKVQPSFEAAFGYEKTLPASIRPNVIDGSPMIMSVM